MRDRNKPGVSQVSETSVSIIMRIAFLGFNNRFKRFRNESWKQYWTLQQLPSKKTMKKMRANIKAVFASPSRLQLSMEEMVKPLNPRIIGMRNYYKQRFTRPWMWKIDKYINQKLTKWYNRKKQRNYRHGNARKVSELAGRAGLVYMCGWMLKEEEYRKAVCGNMSNNIFVALF